MTTTSLEIETTYDVPTDLVSPVLGDLVGAHGVDHVTGSVDELVAIYLDTTDLRLARAGITLRRRTGGHDAGWHLKLPAGRLEKLEVHRALGRSLRPPKALVDLVIAHARGLPLAPVATISTSRSVTRLLDDAGALLVEVADDRVDGDVASSATSQQWREIEVEQGSAGVELLTEIDQRLRAAGAGAGGAGSKLLRLLGVTRDADREAGPRLRRSTAAAEVVRCHLADQVAVLVDTDPRARVDAPDAVHKMRVASRRLRSALATYRPLFEPGATDGIREELQWVGRLLGGPRDAEVMHARLVELLDDLPDELVLGPVRRRVDRELRARHRSAHAELVRELRGDRYLSLLTSLDELVVEPPMLDVAARKAGKALPPLVAKAGRRVKRLAARTAAASGDERDLLLHDVRKAAKRARYAGESVSPALGDKATAYAARMERVQEVLGDHQDSIVTRAMLLELGELAQRAGENAFTYGLLHGLEAGRGDRAEDEFTSVFAKVRSLPGWLR